MKSNPIKALRRHWPEYLIEAAGLGLLMIAIGVFVTIAEHSASPVQHAIAVPWLRRLLTGSVMGFTLTCIINSPWGMRSGAHINPAVTFAFFRLGKIEPWDAFFYVLAQFVGALVGFLLVVAAIAPVIRDHPVDYVVTVPGSAGVGAAFIAEFVISFGLMALILFTSNSQNLKKYTGILAGILLTIYVTVETPLSGVSLNPARTLASALPAQVWTAIWIYFTAPFLGMLLAAEVYLRWKGADAVICAKLHHPKHKPCIFRCGYRKMQSDFAR